MNNKPTNGTNPTNAVATLLLLLPIIYGTLTSLESVFPHSRGIIAAIGVLGGLIKVAGYLNPNTPA